MLTNKTVDRESQQKLYVQMFSIIKEKIETREWPVGSQIPTEDELCRTYDVSKATIRMAIADLVRTGYLKKLQGKGTFVKHSIPDLGITMKTKLTEDMFGEGVSARKELLVKGIKAPPEDVKAYLKAEGDIYYSLCKRVVNSEPAYLEELFIPLESIPDIEEADVCQTPFYEMVQQKASKKIFKVIQMIEITEMTDDAASILKTGVGTPVLLLHRLLVAADGSPIAYTRMMGCGRKYKIQTEMIQIPS
jgi:DNA-binding GntR family transcriptional regulator